MKFRIGPQIPKNAGTQTVSSLSDGAEAIFKWSIIFSILLSFFKVKVYGEILLTLRILAFVVHLPLVGVFLPGMADNVFHRFHQMATYDILEADGIIEGIFSFNEDKREEMAES